MCQMRIWASLTLVDDYGRQTRKVIEMKDLTLLVDQITALEAVITQLAAVTDLGLVRADLIYEGAGTPFAVTAGANVDVGATFSGYLEAGNGKKASTKVPGIKAALVDDDGSIPLDDADMEDWLELFVEDTPYTLMLSDGETIDYWISGSLDR